MQKKFVELLEEMKQLKVAARAQENEIAKLRK
jgi:hypothetical protein